MYGNSFKIIIKGEVEMDYRIEKKDEFRIVGAKEHYVLNVEEITLFTIIHWISVLAADLVFVLHCHGK